MFRKNASLKEKLYTACLLLWMLITVSCLVITDFRPSFYWGEHWLIVVAVAFVIYAPLFIDRHPSNRLWEQPEWKVVVTILGIILVASGFVLLFLQFCLGALYTECAGEPYDARYHVVEKYVSKGRFYVRYDQSFGAKLRVSELEYKEVLIGDVVEVEGKVSRMGWTVEQWELIVR